VSRSTSNSPKTHRVSRVMRFIPRHFTEIGKPVYATVADYCNRL
jgi:hypothetical protein